MTERKLSVKSRNAANVSINYGMENLGFVLVVHDLSWNVGLYLKENRS